MTIVFAFLIGGLICFIAQLLLDGLKLQNVHITVLFVFLGSLLECFNLYDRLIEISGAGALLPICSFGHSMTESAVNYALNGNYFDIFKGVFASTSSGISFAIFISFICSLIFKPKG
ncbi:MAG: SpoVA/SpoVAEb family sporulation membrane protein [Bacilli bacterium]|nr:SpoVA/SpoVAEb family sporulation membrane protein [Bacilli bacterium]